MTRFEARGISAAYGRRQVLFDVDLPDLEAGTVLGLLGPNASGKSTLMRCLSREMAASGSVLLDGLGHLAHEEAPEVVAGKILHAARDWDILPPEQAP